MYGWISIALACAAGSASAAAFNNRHGHTSTLLADGNILIAGGVLGIGAPTNDVQLRVEMRDDFLNLAGAGDMAVARASHTATLLPDGRVLVAGGFDGAIARVEAEFFNPLTSVWTSAGSMNSRRFNHTATLLRNGNVLVCGGQREDGVLLGTCEVFNILSGWQAAGNCPIMLTPRTNHTATIVEGGRVFFTGGFNAGITPSYLPLSEVFDSTATASCAPGVFGCFIPARPLNEGRAYHTATGMGHGKILITGGYSGRERLGSKGILETAEIYDPVADSMVVAPPMKARRHGHSATLDNTGKVTIHGGLGNITTYYFDGGFLLNTGSFLTGRFVNTSGGTGIMSTMTIPAAMSPDPPGASTLSVNMGFNLPVAVTGIIHKGRVILSTPSVTFNDGAAFFKFATTDTVSGLQADLAGTPVFCDPQFGCGRINKTFLLNSIGGYYVFRPITASIAQIFPTAGGFTFNAGPLTPQSLNLIVTAGNVTGSMVINVSGDYIGSRISSGSFTITGGSLFKPSTGTVTLTGGYMVIPANTPINADPIDPSLGRITLAAGNFNFLTGTVNPAAGLESAASPQGFEALMTFSAAGSLNMVVDRINLVNKTLAVTRSTVIIESMVFSDIEEFSPRNNIWSFGTRPTTSRFNHTSVLTPNGDLRIFGGRTCDSASATCALPFISTTGISIIPVLSNWTAAGNMANQRGHHTATVLPNGKVLVAGGSDGPNTWASAELYNPATKTFAPTGSMRNARDLHTASLLPSGRVLTAGGFSPGVASTGSTNTSEIYYPDTAIWIPTSVMVSSRDSHSATVLPDGNVLVVGGYNRGVYLDTAEIFFSTVGIWRQIAAMPSRRANHTATLLPNGEVLIFGGVNENGVLGSLISYNTVGPSAGTWTALAAPTSPPLPAVLVTHSHSATLLPNGEVLYMFGNDGSGSANELAPVFSGIYNRSANAWRNSGVPNTVAGSFNHSATLLPNGIALFTGGAQSPVGSNSSALRRVLTYNVTASSVAFASNLISNRAYHTATLLPSGDVIAIGGYNGTNFLNSTEFIYFTGASDIDTPGAPPSLRAPKITSTNMPLFRGGDSVTIRDSNLPRLVEGGGGGTGLSTHFHPRMMLQALDSSGGTGAQGQSGFLIDLTTRIYQTSLGIPGATENQWSKVIGTDLADSSITVRMPELSSGLQFSTAIPNGWYHLREISNAQYSESILVRVGPPLPSAVSQATGTVLSSTTVFWTWPKTAVADESGYNVFYATSGIFIGSITVPTGVNSASYLQTGLVANTTASLIVTAFTLTGDGPLSYSATSYTLSTAPTSVGFSTVNVNDLVLTWNANGNLPGTIYEVSMSSDDPSSNGKNPFTTSITTEVPTSARLISTAATISNLTENTTYYFRVRACRGHTFLACDPINLSNFSAISSATTRSQVLGVNGTPCASPNGTTCLNWTWTPIGPALKYRVYNATTGVMLSEITQASYPDVSLGTNCPRAVRVSAVTAAGEGPLSEPTTRYTLAATPGAVSPSLTTLSSGTITARWDTNGNPPLTNSCNSLGTEFRLAISTDYFVTSTTFSIIQTGQGLMSLSAGGLFAAEIYGATVTAFNGDGLASEFARNLNSTAAWAVEPTSLFIDGVSLDSVSLGWNPNGNTSSATYQVTYSTDDLGANGKNPFSSHIATDTVANFTLGFNQINATVRNLETAKKYTFRVQARNSSGITTTFSNQVATTTSSGGAVTGSLAGTLKASADTTISGSVGFPTVRTVSLTAPAGAFPSDVVLTMSSHAFDTGLCANTTGIGMSLVTAPPLQPDKPLILTLSYSTSPVNELGNIPANRVTLMRYDPAAAKCVPVPTSVDPDRAVITAYLNHLSFFVVGQVLPSGTVETSRVFPNPFFQSTDSFVTFEQLPAFAQIRIWTLRGELLFDKLATASGTLTWDGTNRWGRQVSSGVYLATVQLGDAKKILKVVVLR